MLDSSPFSGPASSNGESHGAFASRRLRQAFVSCELVPGHYVHEADLEQRFGLGRAAVRVALTELAVAGFVIRHARQGWLVAPVDGALASAIVEARLRLEPALIERSLDDQRKSTLHGLRGAIEAVWGRDDPTARAMAHQLCRQAYDLLAQNAGRFVESWLRDLWDHAERLTRSLELAGQVVAPSDPRPLLAALLAGDREAARQALHDEQTRFRDAVALGFLAAGHLFPQARHAPVRSRRPDRKTNDRKPSPTLSEEKSR